MGNLSNLLKIISALTPLLDWLSKNQANLDTILSVLKKLADMFSKQGVQSLNLDVSRTQLAEMLGNAGRMFAVLASATPNTVDDAIVGVFQKAVSTDWLLDLLALLLSGRAELTPAMVAQAVSEVQGT